MAWRPRKLPPIDLTSIEPCDKYLEIIISPTKSDIESRIKISEFAYLLSDDSKESLQNQNKTKYSIALSGLSKFKRAKEYKRKQSKTYTTGISINKDDNSDDRSQEQLRTAFSEQTIVNYLHSSASENEEKVPGSNQMQRSQSAGPVLVLTRPSSRKSLADSEPKISDGSSEVIEDDIQSPVLSIEDDPSLITEEDTNIVGIKPKRVIRKRILSRLPDDAFLAKDILKAMMRRDVTAENSGQDLALVNDSSSCEDEPVLPKVQEFDASNLSKKSLVPSFKKHEERRDTGRHLQEKGNIQLNTLPNKKPQLKTRKDSVDPNQRKNTQPSVSSVDEINMLSKISTNQRLLSKIPEESKRRKTQEHIKERSSRGSISPASGRSTSFKGKSRKRTKVALNADTSPTRTTVADVESLQQNTFSTSGKSVLQKLHKTSDPSLQQNTPDKSLLRETSNIADDNVLRKPSKTPGDILQRKARTTPDKSLRQKMTKTPDNILQKTKQKTPDDSLQPKILKLPDDNFQRQTDITYDDSLQRTTSKTEDVTSQQKTDTTSDENLENMKLETTDDNSSIYSSKETEKNVITKVPALLAKMNITSDQSEKPILLEKRLLRKREAEKSTIKLETLLHKQPLQTTAPLSAATITPPKPVKSRDKPTRVPIQKRVLKETTGLQLKQTLIIPSKLKTSLQKEIETPRNDSISEKFTIIDEKVEVNNYIQSKGIYDLFNFLTTRLIIDRPEKPLDYLIDTVKTIGARRSGFIQAYADIYPSQA